MTEEQFTSLVERLEVEQKRDPRAYRRKVVLLAYAGYAYIAIVIVGSLAALLASLALMKTSALAAKLVIVVGAFVFLVLRAMWVKLEAPEGHEIRREDAPELFTVLDRLQKALHVHARFDHVLITDDFNAAVVQVPRLGILGWHRNYLLIGLPLMKALSRKQLAAVLAHELGHLAGGHGRLGNWVYRLRFGWARLAAMLQESGSAGGFMFRPFFQRYVPYFNAVSFPLARANEYEADANAARLTSPTAAAAALTTVNVMGSFLHAHYWPDIHRNAMAHARPDGFSPFSQMGTAMTSAVDATTLRGFLTAATGWKTSVADTHPALADRLRALNQEPRLSLPSPSESSDSLLGAALPSINDTFDKRWQHGITPVWEQRYQQAQEDRRELNNLETRVANGETLSVDDRFKRAMLTEEIGSGKDAAMEQLRTLHDQAPEHAPTCFTLGARLLERDDESGAELIERAMEREPDAADTGTSMLRDFYAKHGRQAEADTWHKRWIKQQELRYFAELERSHISAADTFEPHSLNDDQIETLRAQLAALGKMRKVWLVRKKVQHLSEQPVLVVGFITTPWYWPATVKRMIAMRDRIARQIVLQGSVTVICVESGNSPIRKRMNKVPGARII
jgi:Zn-dependent protease with chaperone function